MYWVKLLKDDIKLRQKLFKRYDKENIEYNLMQKEIAKEQKEKRDDDDKNEEPYYKDSTKTIECEYCSNEKHKLNLKCDCCKRMGCSKGVSKCPECKNLTCWKCMANYWKSPTDIEGMCSNCVERLKICDVWYL